MPEILKLPANDQAPLRLEIPRPRPAAKPSVASVLPARHQRQTGGEAGQTVASNLTELKQLRDEAQRSGFEQGLAQAEALEAQKAKAQADFMAALSKQMEQHVAQVEQAACALALACMTRLLGEAMATPAGALACIRQVLAEHPELVEAELCVHPKDALAVQELLAQVGTSRGDGLRVVADPRVTLGGCHLRSSRGDLNAGIETLWRGLAATLAAARAER